MLDDLNWSLLKKVSEFDQQILYHNHTLQTNPQRREKEPQNNNSHTTSGRQLKQPALSLSLSLSHQDDCKSKDDTNQCITYALLCVVSLFLIKIIAKLKMTQSNA